MKKFIVDKSSLDSFIRHVEEKSRFMFNRKVNRDLMNTLSEIINNNLENYRKAFTVKVGGKFEYHIVVTTKAVLETIDVAVSHASSNQTICQESYEMPTTTLPPFTYIEVINSLYTCSPLFTYDQLETLLQTSITKNSAMACVSGGMNIVTDFQNDILTCNIFNDESIVKTLHYFIPKESHELGFTPTLYRYLGVSFDHYEGAYDRYPQLEFLDSIDTLVDRVVEWSQSDNATISKILQKLLYAPNYKIGDIEAVIHSAVVPQILFMLGDKRYQFVMNKTLIGEIVGKSGERYKTALRESLLDASKHKVPLSPADATITLSTDKPEGKPSLVQKSKGKKREPAPVKEEIVEEDTQNVSTEKKLTDYNLRKLFFTIKNAEDPEKAYDEIIKFIGDEVEFKGKITHKDMLVMYHFSHDNTAVNESEAGLKIDIKINRLNGDNPSQAKKLFCFTIDAKREDVTVISSAFSYLRNMFN